MKQDTILICDDSDLILMTTSLVLNSRGFDVDTAKSTDDIHRKIEIRTPALILLDLNIPAEGGESVVQSLRNNIKTKDIPVVLFSAEQSLPEIAAKLAVDGFLRKPFENEELIEIVERHVHHGI